MKEDFGMSATISCTTCHMIGGSCSLLMLWVIYMDEIDAISGQKYSEGTSADQEIQRGCFLQMTIAHAFTLVIESNGWF